MVQFTLATRDFGDDGDGLYALPFDDVMIHLNARCKRYFIDTLPKNVDVLYGRVVANMYAYSVWTRSMC